MLKIQKISSRPLSIMGGVVTTVLAGLILIIFPIGDSVRTSSYDNLYHFRSSYTPEDIVIVYLDEISHSALNQPHDKIWDRALHAQLLDVLTSEGAKLIIYDIVFELESSNHESDEKLANAIKENGNVILGASIQVFKDKGLKQEIVEAPYYKFRKVARGWGLLNVKTDTDLAVRKISFGLGELQNSMWLSAQIIDPELLNSRISLKNNLYINYHGPPDSSDSISFHKVLQEDGFRKDFFRDKIVLIGAKYESKFTGSGRDTFRTPYSMEGSNLTDGVVIHANVLNTLINQDWLVGLPTIIEVIIVIFAGVIITLILHLFEPRISVIIAIAICIFFSIGSILIAWHYNVFYSWIVPSLIQTPIAFVWAVGGQYYVEKRRKRKIVKAFEAYVNPYVVNKIAESEIDVKLGGKLKNVTILFTDLQGFTQITESSNPEEISFLLQSYFSICTDNIFSKNGTVIKFIGDAVMAVWGAPLSDKEQENNAVLAAKKIIEETKKRKFYGHYLHTRIGINSGKALAGNLGSKERFDYTVIGDDVNLASRLEGLNKYLGTNILVAKNTNNALGEDIPTRYVGKFEVVGKADAVSVYEILTISKNDSTNLKWIKTFEEALELFSKKEFLEAEKLLNEVDEFREDGDGPAKFYLVQIHEYLAVPPKSKYWAGEITLSGK